MRYEYKVTCIHASYFDYHSDPIDDFNKTINNLAQQGWELFKVIHVKRFRDTSERDVILHYYRRKVKK